MATTFEPRRRALAVALASVLLSTLGACGGGTHPAAAPAPAPLPVGTFTRTFPPGAGDSSTAAPFLGDGQDFKLQYLYAADELGGAGVISALRFQRLGVQGSPITCPAWSIRLGHTSRAALETSFAANVDASSLTTVVASATVTIPAGSSGEWFEVPLAAPFHYDGVLNLVVEIEASATCSGVSWYWATTDRPSVGCLSTAQDTDPAIPEHSDTTCMVSRYRPCLKVVFSGGEMLAVPGVKLGGPVAYPFTNVPARTQHLLRAADIDGAGPITGIGFEPGFPAPAGGARYEFTVRMGNTTRTALGESFEANFATSAVSTVADHVTFTVPVATAPGRFFWIPLTGAFDYNGRDNLVVEIRAYSGTANLNISFVFADGPSHLYAFAPDAATGTLSNVAYRVKLRFRGAPLTLAFPPGGPSQVGLGQATLAAAVLYDSTLFGTGGRIEALGLRLAGPTSVSSAPALKIYMGTTAKTALSTSESFASSLDGETVVFDGPFAIPAGLRTGDWVRIPLRTPFTWTPEKNLSILFVATATDNAPPTWKAMAPAYNGHTVYSTTGFVSTADIPPLGVSQISALKLHLAR